MTNTMSHSPLLSIQYNIILRVYNNIITVIFSVLQNSFRPAKKHGYPILYVYINIDTVLHCYSRYNGQSTHIYH
jgi:hypothetical protein